MALPNTHFGPAQISAFLSSGRKRIFFDGIGGVSMSSLAEVCLLRGHEVSGYDRTPSELTRSLEKKGARIYYVPDEAHIADADLLVYTLAMPSTNPEYVGAASHGIPRVSRADFLGYLMAGYAHRIGISGTHGKSTTTGMVARILEAAGVSPTVFNGAVMKESGSCNLIGGRDYFAFEACEYMDSFLDLSPTAAVVLNVELDHVDYFPSLEAICESFRRFLSLTGENGTAVINADDENAKKAAAGYAGTLVTFALDAPDADYRAADLTVAHGLPSFTVLRRGEKLASVRLKIPGIHNVSNALAAAAVCSSCGIPAKAIAEGLNAYRGICRRMEWQFGLANGAAVYADYAHHPTEIRATLSGACALCPGRVKVIFQPHTYSRTKELFSDFVSAFAESGADEVILCDIYPARETNVYGVTSAQLGEAIRERGKACAVLASPEEAAAFAETRVSSGDMLLVMGAGDVIHAVDALRKGEENEKTRGPHAP